MASSIESLRAQRELFHYARPAKSMLVVFILWSILGLFGAARFYTGRFNSGLVQFTIMITGLALSIAGVFHLAGFLFLATTVWAWIDVFLMWGWVRRYNETRGD